MTEINNNDSTINKRSSRRFTEESEGKPLTEALLKWWIGRKPSKTRNIWHGNGLFIRITTTGKMIWKLNYSIPKTGKRSIMTLGHYSDERNLAWAIIEASKKTAQAQNSVDPYLEQKKLKDEEKKYGKTFKEVAELWYDDKIKNSMLAEVTKQNIIGRIKKHLYPVIGDKIYRSLTFEILYNIIKNKYKEQINKNNKQTKLVYRLIADLQEIQKWAKQKKYIKDNITENLADECKGMKTNTIHRAAMTDYRKIGEYLNNLDAYEAKGWEAVKEALFFITYIPVRSKELIGARVKELDIDRNIWKIPAERMKSRKEFEIPLPEKMMNILKERIKNNKYTEEDFIFQHNGKQFYKTIIRMFLVKIGYKKEEVTIHGFRATFSTIMRDADIYNEEIIERNLAHSYGSKVSKAYNRGGYIEKRRQCYEDYGYILDGLKEGRTFNDIVKELKRKHFEEYMNDNNMNNDEKQ